MLPPVARRLVLALCACLSQVAMSEVAPAARNAVSLDGEATPSDLAPEIRAADDVPQAPGNDDNVEALSESQPVAGGTKGTGPGESADADEIEGDGEAAELEKLAAEEQLPQSVLKEKGQEPDTDNQEQIDEGGKVDWLAVLAEPVMPYASTQAPHAEPGLGIHSWPAGRLPTWSLELGYVLWGLEDVFLPTLLVSNPIGTPLADVGRLGAPSTRILVGNEDIGDSPQSGLRARVARQISGRHRFELSGWFLFQRGDDWNVTSWAGDPVLSRPFVDATSMLSEAQVISMQGVVGGSFEASYERSLISFEPLIYSCLSSDGCYRSESFAGYRFLRYEDELRIEERLTIPAGGAIAPGTEFRVSDSFRASNDFHVLPIGLSYTRNSDHWRLNVSGGVGVGFVRQQVAITGRTDISVAGAATQTYPAGLLALASNVGSHNRYRFAWVPQLDLRLERKLSQKWSAHVGYSALYLNEVARAPDHIDTVLDPRAIPPSLTGTIQRPAFEFRSSGKLLHGINIGVRRDF